MITLVIAVAMCISRKRGIATFTRLIVIFITLLINERLDEYRMTYLEAPLQEFVKSAGHVTLNFKSPLVLASLFSLSNFSRAGVSLISL